MSRTGRERGRAADRLRRIRRGAADRLTSSLWPLPVLGILAAFVLGGLVPALDRSVDDRLPGWLTDLTFGGDAGAAQTVLDAVASSLITVTSLTFSLTVVTLQLASSQFSPRLLRTFTRDTFVQATLALFLATFVYSLSVLRLIRSGGDGEVAFVPRIAVTLAFLLAVASVVALVLFLAHLSQTIRVEAMVEHVRREAVATVRSSLSATRSIPSEGERRPGAGARLVVARSTGFVTGVDADRLCRAAARADAVVHVTIRPGDFVGEGDPVGHVAVAPGGGHRDDPDDLDDLVDRTGRAVRVGFERTARDDIGFGLRQLTDVATKALSPGINDPTTAVHAIGHVGVLLAELLDHDPGPRVLRDDDGRARVVLAEPEPAELLETALEPLRCYGADDAAVVDALLALLERLARAAPAHRGCVALQLARLETAVAAETHASHVVDRHARSAAAVRRALDAEE